MASPAQRVPSLMHHQSGHAWHGPQLSGAQLAIGGGAYIEPGAESRHAVAKPHSYT